MIKMKLSACQKCGYRQPLKDFGLEYNLELEYALAHMFGSKYYNWAAMFENVSYTKRVIKDWIKRTQQRMGQLTEYDDRLYKIVSINLDSLNRRLSEYPKELNEWKIIAALIEIINHLLGYDFRDGKIHRHILFYQDKGQQMKDMLNMGEMKYDELRNSYQITRDSQKMLARTLKSEGKTIFQTSLILNQSPSHIKRLLK